MQSFMNDKVRCGDFSGSRTARPGVLDLKLGSLKVRSFVFYFLIIATSAAWVYSLTIAAAVLGFLAVVYICFAPARQLLCLLFAALPFFNVLGTELGGTSFFYLAVIVFAAKFCIEENDSLRLKILAILVLLTFSAINLVVPVQYFRWLLLCVPLILVYKSAMLRSCIANIILLCSFSAVLSAFVGIAFANVGSYLYMQGYVYLDSASSITRYAGLIGDSVVFGQFMVVLISANVSLIALKRSKSVVVSWLLVFAMSLFCCLTYSKTAIMLLAFVAVIACAFFVGDILNRGVGVAHLGAIVVGAVGTLGLIILLNLGYFDSFISGITARLMASDLFTGRFQIWGNYLDLWSQQGLGALLSGVGIETYNLTNVYLGFNRTHNVFLEGIICFGLPLSLVALCFVVKDLFCAVKRGGALYSSGPVIILLVSGAILHGLLEFPYYFEWMIALGLLDGSDRSVDGINARED